MQDITLSRGHYLDFRKPLISLAQICGNYLEIPTRSSSCILPHGCRVRRDDLILLISMYIIYPRFLPCQSANWPSGKASVSGAGDRRFESCVGRFSFLISFLLLLSPGCWPSPVFGPTRVPTSYHPTKTHHKKSKSHTQSTTKIYRIKIKF